jgi:hypothetical protein
MASFATLLHDLSAGRIALVQGKLIGRVIYVLTYLYAVYLAFRNQQKMLLGCFIALFFLVALATSKFEIWYALWPVVLAVLAGRRELSLAAFLLTYGSSISVTMYVYLWVWMGVNNQTVQIIHAMAYLISFAPAILLLLGIAARSLLALAEGRSEARLLVAKREKRAESTKPLLQGLRPIFAATKEWVNAEDAEPGGSIL